MRRNATHIGILVRHPPPPVDMEPRTPVPETLSDLLKMVSTPKIMREYRALRAVAREARRVDEAAYTTYYDLRCRALTKALARLRGTEGRGTR